MKKALVESGSRKKEVSGRDALLKLLRWHFGYAEFRGKQLEAIETVMSGLKCLRLITLSPRHLEAVAICE